MSTPTIANQDRAAMKDVTVLSLANLPTGGGAAGTAIDYLGIIQEVEISLKREFEESEGNADGFKTKRALRWDFGTVRLSGFSAATASKFALGFAQGSHMILSFTERATGDVYSLVCTCEEFSKSLGKGLNKDTLSLGVEGQPYLNGAAMVLD